MVARTTCRFAKPCSVHGGAIHGGEAEELRAGIEAILSSDVPIDEWRHELQRLLDRVDARDSLAFREATDP